MHMLYVKYLSHNILNGKWCTKFMYWHYNMCRISGKIYVGHLKFPWERADSKKLFYNEYNQFEKIPQNDDSTSDNQNEFA